MQTQALVPHRDAVLKLSRFSKKIIYSFNKENHPGNFAFPIFPLWSFADFFPDTVTKAEILFPKSDGKNFYFPPELWNGDLKREYRINFAAIHCGTENAMPNMDDGFCSEFPLSVPCYKTGLAVIENNSWKIFDEKWFKIGKKQHE